ncbi:MAG: hypothetical protein JWO38_3644 [Gemmataceae bacterium]|nr:hypothetical protein [Gemmataceae bacterium]
MSEKNARVSSPFVALRGWFTALTHRKTRRPDLRSRLRLEAIEERWVPSLSISASLSGSPTAMVSGNATSSAPMTQLAVHYTWGDTTVTDTTTPYSPASTTGMFGNSHTYSTPGTYSVGINATATHPDGTTDTDAKTYSVTIGSPTSPPPTSPPPTSGPGGYRFTLPSGMGVFSYTIPVDQVNPSLPSQHVMLPSFSLSIGPYIYTPSTSNFTVPPYATISYGTQTGVTFALAIPPAQQQGYQSLSMDNGTMTGVNMMGGTDTAVVADDRASLMALDFSTVTFSTLGTYTWAFKVVTGPNAATIVNVTIPQAGTAGATAKGVRDLVADALAAKNIPIEKTGDNFLTIWGPTGTNLTLIDIYANLSPIPGGPKLQLALKGSGMVVPELSFRNQ